MSTEAHLHRFEGRVALVTGAAQGIGLGIARRLASEGARVALIDRNASQLPKAEKALKAEGHEAFAMVVDITSENEVRRAVATVMERWGRIDALVTAAGILGNAGVPAHQVDMAEYDRVMEVNVHGMFLCIQAVLPHMIAAKFGRIFNIASISGKDGNAGMLPYSTSKAAVIGLTKVIGKEFAELGITCNTIAPALIETEMITALPAEKRAMYEKLIPMGRVGTIEEVAAVAAFATSPEASFTSGFVFDASGGRALY